MPDFDLDGALSSASALPLPCPNCGEPLELEDTEDPFDNYPQQGKIVGRVVCSRQCCTERWRVTLQLTSTEDADGKFLMSAQDYLENGKHCPCCESRDVDDSGFPAQDSASLFLTVQCNRCTADRALWWEVYVVDRLIHA